ncbi:hypothetical protein Vretimale_12462 [Volvox reticuliferus]|uniref:DUF4460 domain-containing protein n=1 Tax=Volvox reticuliferus TaxID=1737510 RepID=A0A8J4FK91_9CHLO|nr:hypothetical protein Vretifemale_9123 [Volvox reticuliferus]GIM08457.1 hypothetical protein Vretimale_12462 [Volvox reticuliferus]
MNPTVSFIRRSTKTYIEAVTLESSERLQDCDCSSFYDIWKVTATDISTAAANAEIAAGISTCIQSQYMHHNGKTKASTSTSKSIKNCYSKGGNAGCSGNNGAIHTTCCKNQSDHGTNRRPRWEQCCLASVFGAHCIIFPSAAILLDAVTATTSRASSCQLQWTPWWTQDGRAVTHRHRHTHTYQRPAEHQLLVDLMIGEGEKTVRSVQGRTWQPLGGGAAAALRFQVRGFASSVGERTDGVGTAAGDGGGGEPRRAMPLRPALRLLYKRVHPDLFHDLPRAKDENERSFKLLQEYVQLAQGGDPRSPAARLPYRFAFYLREAPQGVESEELEGARGPPTSPLRPPVGARSEQQQLQQQVPVGTAARDSEAAANGNPRCEDSTEVAGLHLVRVTLPPPTISAPGAKELAAPTRKALIKLLAACGLASTGRVGEEVTDDNTVAAEDGGPLSLAAFLPDAVEAMRQVEAARASDPAVRVANLRGAMRMHRQVMVSFSDKQLPAATQASLLERLARVVDAAGPELQLQGCHIVLGDRLGLDRMGHLCLSAAESNDTWMDFLNGVDMDFVRQQRKNVQVAQAAGVAQVFTPYANLMEPSYREFLERLAAMAATQGPLGDGAFRDVSLCGMPPLPSEPGQPCTPACRLDGTTPGVIQVATDAPDADIYEGVAKLGTDAQVAVRMHRNVESQLAELSSKTRQRLRMRSFTRDPRVTPDRFRRACGLLLEQAAALMPLLEGCSVRIGFANRVAPDGSCIEIAHNFEL